MAIVELFSDRQKRLKDGVPDVYTYDEIPDRLRGQICFVIADLIDALRAYRDLDGETQLPYFYGSYIMLLLRRERGEFSDKGSSDILYFIEYSKKFNDIMDVTELFLGLYCGFLSKISEKYRDTSRNYDIDDSTINIYNDKLIELNKRFINAGVGYQFENGQFIRIDNQFIHAEVMKPTLSLLNQDMYKSAQDEFLLAHKHYRDENYEDCLKNCANSFESVMKIICHKRRWQHDPSRDAAKTLIDVIVKNGLIPDYLGGQFRAILQGIADLRNKNGGHGRGISRTEPPRYFAEFMLHQTAAVILMLVRAEEALTP